MTADMPMDRFEVAAGKGDACSPNERQGLAEEDPCAAASLQSVWSLLATSGHRFHIYRIGCIAIVLQTCRKKHLLMAILSRDRAHISSKEPWGWVSYNDR